MNAVYRQATGLPRVTSAQARMYSSFETDSYPGRPRVLFIGFGRSTHAQAWIDLLEGAAFNVRFFGAPTGGIPPADWPVRSYVSEYYTDTPNSPTRLRLFPRQPIARFAKRNVARLLKVGDPNSMAGKWLARIIRDWQPHVIHTLGLEDAAYFYLGVRRQFGLQNYGKWVSQVRGGPELALRRLSQPSSDKIREVLRECDQLIADNEQNYSYAAELGLRSEQRSALGVVPGTGGIDVEGLVSQWSGMPSLRRDIVWPKAYNCPQSIAQPVLEAIKMVWPRIQPCKIYMLASTPETRMWFQTLPEEIRRHCQIEEWISRARLLELMTESRVMLAPSLIDGVPNSMYEAMAAGAFPIVSPLETIQAVVENERSVLFARNLYPQEIADALLRAMSDDALVDRAAQDNLKLVRQLADRNEIRLRVIRFYEELAGEPGAPYGF